MAFSDSAGLRHRILRTLSVGPVAPLLATGFAFIGYGCSVAPGLTWANYGADGGDLLAAAVLNGTPHPTGYPLYTLLLQGWLVLLGLLLPGSELAWRGNLFSALAGALSVGVMFQVVRHLWIEPDRALLPALLAAGGWAISPLLWGQALITEVYTLHALLFAAIFWALLALPPRPFRRRALVLGGLFGLGLAHHVTIGLLLPGMLYWLWSEEAGDDNQRPSARRPVFWLWWGVGLLPGLLLYARIPLAASFAPNSPVLWSGSGSPGDFWWLVSGAAYRRYLLAVPIDQLLPKISQWAQVITSQLTPIGLALALAGLHRWDRLAGRLRTLGLLWVLFVSLYAVTYHTADSEVYLLPVVWLMAVWMPFGVVEMAEWLDSKRPWIDWQRVLLAGCVAGLVGLTVLRFPSLTLRQDDIARRFLDGAIGVLQPESLVFSSADAETFALWYAAWGSGDLLQAAPGTVLVNVALLQFGWYRELLVRLYPDLDGVASGDAAAILRANAKNRPIYFSEIILPATADHLRPTGTIWRYEP